jgi:fluoride exporter
MAIPAHLHRSAHPTRRHHVIAYRRELIAVFLGGCAGALLRVLLIEAFPVDPGHWPWATVIANLLGAFALGVISTLLPPSAYGRPLLGTGFCGALTTFSTMQLELLRMLERGEEGLALIYASVSIVAGLLAVIAGTALVRGRSEEP